MDEIGQKLRTARIEKGYTLDDLQQITKIQKRYLIAIEEGNFDALPGDFYVRAFIKQYADTVGLDSGELLTQFQQDIPPTQPEEYVAQSVENKSRATRTVENSPARRLKARMPQILIVLVALVILGIVYGIILSNGRNNKTAIPDNSSTVSLSSKESTSNETSSKKSSSSKQSSSESSASDKDKDKPLELAVTNPTPAAQNVAVKKLPATGNKLTITANNAAVWVSVTIGTNVTEKTLNPGASETIDLPDNTQTFSVRTGNGPATQIKLNDTAVDLSGSTGYVRTITFTTESAGTQQ